MHVSEKLAYSHEGFALEGIIFRPEEVRGNTPGLLLIHEFTGLGEHIFHNARLFAEKGFTVLCCDMSCPRTAETISTVYKITILPRPYINTCRKFSFNVLTTPTCGISFE